MKVLSLHQFLIWIFSEYSRENSVFGLNREFFYYHQDDSSFKMFDHEMDTILGPAAGPHTQLTQNIVTAYLAGSRYIELKTVQENDNLEIDRPCIDACDEGYNVEWSQELKLAESFNEYLKARLIIIMLNEIFKFSTQLNGGVIFNMSVGYNLAGIKSEKVDSFINKMVDAKKSELFHEYKNIIIKFIHEELPRYQTALPQFDSVQLIRRVESASALIAESVTLSTMHGCPAEEIGQIAEYLLFEKNLPTLVKLNPTLVGYERVRAILDDYGYRTVQLDKEDFEHDLQFNAAVELIKKLNSAALNKGKFFGLKLSNTLCTQNTRGKLKGEKNYLSGKALYPITLELVDLLKKAVPEITTISYSGGLNSHNLTQILATGCAPLTLATDLLKPGGYARLFGLAVQLNEKSSNVLIDKKQFERNFSALKRVRSALPLPLFDCFEAPCRIACPVGQDVPAYLELCRQERYLEAFETVIQANPLPHITGWICDHKCQFSCTRGEYSDPVEIRAAKKQAAELGYQAYLATLKKHSAVAEKIAVVGAGPAGLVAAYFAAKEGFSVTVFEKESSAGGTVSKIIPGFRIPLAEIEKDLNFIRLHGVEFKFNSEIKDLNQLFKQGFKYIFTSIGAGKAKDLQLAENRDNIIEATAFLKDFNGAQALQTGKKIVVIGGGNSAMDSARAAIRVAGVESVEIVYRRTKDQMPADLEEFDAAMADGVSFRELSAPIKYSEGFLHCQKMSFSAAEKDGRLSIVPVAGEVELIAADTLILAVGEEVDRNFLSENKLSINRGTVETNHPNIFIGGDALRGPATVIEAAADGKEFVRKILNLEQRPTMQQFRQLQFFNQKEIPGLLLKRKKDLLSAKNKSAHSDSCLLCHLECNRCVEVCPNRANIAIRVDDSADFKDRTQVIHLFDLCNECGNCASFCPYDAAPYQDKFTWFSNLDEMSASSNSGFCIRKNITGYKLYIRKLKGGWQQELNTDELAIGDLRMKKVIAAFIDQYGFLIEQD